MWKLEFILCLLCPLAVVFAIPCSIEDMQAVCHEHWKGDYVTWDCRSASTFNVLDCNIPSRIKIHHLIFREGILHTTAAVPFAWVSSIQKLSLLYIQNEISLATILYLFPMVEELNVTGTTVSLTNRVSNTVRLKELSGLVINASVPSLSELGLHTLESLQVKVMDPEQFHAGFLNDLALIKLDFTSEYHESFNWSVISNRAFALKQLKLKFKSLREFPIRCPFHALVVLSITVAEARFVRETLFMTTSSIPLPYLRALKLSGFWLPQPTSFVGFNLEILEISNSKGNIANLRHYPAHLKMLRISYCKMDTIQYRAFGILRQLITLDLAFNGIRYIDQDAFQTYPAIQTLLLNNNKLNSLFLSQGDLRQLRILDVSYNQLVVMSIHWLNRTTLAHLRARHNQITRFAENIQSEVISGSSFKVLDLRENPLVCSCDLGILLHLLPSDSKKLGYCRYNTTAANYRISRFYVQDCKLAQFNASEDYEMQSDQSHDSVRLIATTAEDKLRESLSILKSMTTAPEKPSILKANYGTSFTQFAHVYTGVEMFLVHINLLFPNFTLPYFEWDDESFVALCKDQDSLVQTICADFTPLVRRAVQRIDHYSKTLRWKLSQIHDLYGLSFMGGKDSNAARSRRTRSLPNDALERLKLFPEKANDSSLLKTGLSKFEVTIDDSDWQDEEDDIFWKSAFLAPLGATKMARTYAKRHQIFKDTIGHLASRQILIKEAFIDLRGDLLTAVNMIADSFNATSANIYTLHELLNRTNYQIVDAFKALGRAVNVIQRKTHAIRILSVLTTKYLQLWSQQVHSYHILNQEADRLFAAASQLVSGKISPYLVPPEPLRKVLKEAARKLNSWHTDYELVYSKMSLIYEHANVIFVPVKNGFLIQLLLPIRARDAKRYDLYKAESVHMPVNTSPRFDDEEANHDFTKIQIDRPFLGVSQTNFVELSVEELEMCDHVDGAYYCYHTILEMDNDILSCLTAIYMDAPVDKVSALCEVSYFFEPFRPIPAVIEAGDQILVSGLSTPWTRRCMTDRIPFKVKGSMYAIINRTALCYCSITAQNGFIPRRVTDCPNPTDAEPPQVLVEYSMNSLVLQSLKTYVNFSKLPTQNIESETFILPKLTIAEEVSMTQLINISQGAIKLKSLSKVIEQKGEDFVTRWNELSADMSFASWFTAKYWLKGVSFAGGIAGILSLLITGFMFCQSYYNKGVLTSVMFAANSPGARAMEISDFCETTDLTVTLSSKSHLYITMSHIAIILLVTLLLYCGKRMVMFCMKEARYYAHHPLSRGHPSIEIFLELHSGVTRVILYIVSVKADISKLHFDGILAPTSLTLDNHTFYSILRPNWYASTCSFLIDSVEVELPSLIKIPLYKRGKVQTIMKGNFQCTMIASDGLFLYRLGAKTHEIISDSQANPYSQLIKELKQREAEFEKGPISSNAMRQSVEMTALPSAPDIDLDHVLNLDEYTVV